jgi:hypothetical protein
MTPLSLASRAAGALLLAAVVAFPGSAQSADFKWNGPIAAGKTLIIRGVNGGIIVDAATGRDAEIIGIKQVRRGDPALVRVELQRVGSDKGDVLVCAFFNPRTTCDENGYAGPKDNSYNTGLEASVEFRVKVPAGVEVIARTVNGDVKISGATARVDAMTVNGGMRAVSSGGPVIAKTVNGSLDVSMGSLPINEDATYETTNGSVTVRVGGSVDADVEMRTVNGEAQSDFPLTVSGRINPKRISATLGKGGRKLSLRTVNGDVRLIKN